jgi:phospholipase B1
LRDYLISNPNVNIEEDYKLVTVLIGPNDACPLCEIFSDQHITPDVAAEYYYNNISEAMNMLYKNIPRTIVNVLLPFNVSQAYELSLPYTYCRDFHDVIPIECPCAFDSDDLKRLQLFLLTFERHFLDTTLQKYGDKWIQLATEWQSKNLTDFAIVVQPFTRNRI